MTTAAPTGALARVIRRSSTGESPSERCDVCGAAVPEVHRHMIEELDDGLRCACHACAVLFERDAAARGRYRLIPPARKRLPEMPLDDLGLPVGIAFLVTGDDGVAVAHFPSPAGATRSEFDTDAWRRVVDAWPQLAELEPRVQALLLNTARGSREHWIVPIDDCYRLVAVVRQEWRGLSGGTAVWPAIADFFAGLGERSTTHG
jgi:hypothetical protein